jgi:acetylglutamate kinase
VDFFQSLLQAGLSIVMAPITHDHKGQLLNTNADTIAQELAKALSSQYEVDLIYCFEKAGVLRDVQDNNSLIRKINPADFESLKTQQIISAGMLPKLENAFAAVHAGVKKVIIGNYAELQLLVQQRAGTTITHE